MYPIKQNGIQEKFLKIGIMVVLVAIATIGIGMANANRVLGDDSEEDAARLELMRRKN
ncbi:MAG: hypothetical protein WAM42_26520 [Candidatus Nitrosopolaris sp.]|jgi:hypothetical protein